MRFRVTDVQSSVWALLSFITGSAILYVLAIVLIMTAVSPKVAGSTIVAINHSSQTPYVPAARSTTELIGGIPIRIYIPASGIDLPLDPGYYDASSGAWTLSGYRAQFAMMSTEANNLAGETFVYGHNNNFVFGPLRHVTPAIGAVAYLYTSNGHIFSYSFTDSENLTPQDTSILNYSGPPELTIQTCTGSLNQYRTMYQFAFSKVIL